MNAGQGMFRYGVVEAALARLRQVRPEALGAFKGRIIHFQRVGLGAASPGKGRRIEYTYEHICIWAFCFELADFGITPSEISRIVQWVWREVGPVLLDGGGSRVTKYFVAHARMISQADLDAGIDSEKILGYKAPPALGICSAQPSGSSYVLDEDKVGPKVLKRSMVINLTQIARGLKEALDQVLDEQTPAT